MERGPRGERRRPDPEHPALRPGDGHRPERSARHRLARFPQQPDTRRRGARGNDGGFNDVYYTFSTDRGRTLQPNIRISDRSINRTIGVWSNNTHIHAHLGVASTDDAAYFAWQDTRNGNPQFQSEDVYFASARFAEPAREEEDSSVPGWIKLGVGILVGMGLAMLIVLAVNRRGGPAKTA